MPVSRVQDSIRTRFRFEKNEKQKIPSFENERIEIFTGGVLNS